MPLKIGILASVAPRALRWTAQAAGWLRRFLTNSPNGEIESRAFIHLNGLLDLVAHGYRHSVWPPLAVV